MWEQNILLIVPVKNLKRSSLKVLITCVKSFDQLCVIISSMKPDIKKSSKSNLNFLLKYLKGFNSEVTYKLNVYYCPYYFVFYFSYHNYIL